jgi:hypothetical protein
MRRNKECFQWLTVEPLGWIMGMMRQAMHARQTLNTTMTEVNERTKTDFRSMNLLSHTLPKDY